MQTYHTIHIWSMKQCGSTMIYPEETIQSVQFCARSNHWKGFVSSQIWKCTDDHWWYDLSCRFFYCDKPEDFPDHSLPLIPRVYLSYLIYVSFFLSSFSILDFHYMWICPGEPSQALAKDIVTFLQAVVQEWETITDSKLESFLNFHS
jgi:hypothetical protein